MAHEDDLAITAAALLSVAELVFGEGGLHEDLDRLLEFGCDLLAECSGGSIALLVEGQPTTAAMSDAVALEIDLAQYRAGQGPCLLALEGDVVRVSFVATDERFVHFAIGVRDLDVASVLSTPIRFEGTVVGTLNLYSHQGDAFGAASQHTALLLAAEAATAIARSRAYQRAQDAEELIARQHEDASQISMAQGVLMSIEDCTAEQAMALLEDASSDRRESLVEAARRILAVASSPEGLPPSDRPDSGQDASSPTS